MKNFTLHFDNEDQCDSLDRLRPRPSLKLGTTWHMQVRCNSKHFAVHYGTTGTTTDRLRLEVLNLLEPGCEGEDV